MAYWFSDISVYYGGEKVDRGEYKESKREKSKLVSVPL